MLTVIENKIANCNTCLVWPPEVHDQHFLKVSLTLNIFVEILSAFFFLLFHLICLLGVYFVRIKGVNLTFETANGTKLGTLLLLNGLSIVVLLHI